jgi:multicomponent Na+:H+ antiporter subunit E
MITTDTARRANPVISFTIWSLTFSFLWWVITDGANDSWSTGLPVVALAALWRTVARKQDCILSLTGLLRFLPFFAWHSLKGGIDVAGRALRRDCGLTPVIVELQVRLPPGPARLTFVNAASLLPGTQVVGLAEDRLHVHALNRRGDFRRELQLLETRTAALFGLSLPASSEQNMVP